MGNLVKNDNGLMSKKTDKLFNEYFGAIDDMFSSMMNSPFKGGAQLSKKITKMNSQIEQTDEGLSYTLPVPGCTKDDVSVEMEDNIITVEAETESDTYHGKYYDKFVYNNDGTYNEDGIEAKVENGLLTITLPFNKSSPSKDNKRKIM